MNLAQLSQVMSERLAILSLETALLAGLAWVGARYLRRRSARLAALLWMLVLLKPLAGLVFGAPVVIHHWTQPEFFSAEPDFDALLLDEPTATTAPPMDAGVAPMSPSNIMPQAKPAIATPPSPARAHWTLPSGRDLLLLGWLVGAFAVFAWWAWGRIGLRTVIARARRYTQVHPADVEPLRAQSASIAKSLGLRHAPPLYLSDELESPALAGCINPVILLPAWMAEADEEMVRWALRHELVHYKHGDPWFLGLRQLACVVFFFHPLVWWAGRRWEEAAELACDRALVEGEGDARVYARKLYGMLEHVAHRRQARLAGGLFATRTQLGKRIAALLGQPLAGSARLGALATMALLLLSCIVLTVGSRFVQAAKNDVAVPEPAESAPVVPPSATAEIAATTDEFLSSLLKLKAETGRENSLLYYFQAAAIPVKLTLSGEQILNAPPNAKIAAEQKQYFADCQPAFALLRQGAALNQAEWPPLPGDWEPRYLHVQGRARAMHGEGNAFLRNGEVDKALANYMVPVVVGDHLCASGAPFVPYLVGLAVRSIGVGALGELVPSGKLSDTQLSTVAQLLAHVDRPDDGMAAVVKAFTDVRLAKLDPALRQKRLADFFADRYEGLPGVSDEEMRQLRTLEANPDAVLKYEREWKALCDARLAMPYEKREPLNWFAKVREAEAESGLPLARLDFAWEHADIRDRANLAELRNLRVIVAAERFKLKLGDYPSRAADLLPAYLPAMPNDPFTGKPLQYERRGEHCVVYSLGPDLASQSGQITYDPTNGLQSAGDIVR